MLELYAFVAESELLVDPGDDADDEMVAGTTASYLKHLETFIEGLMRKW